MKLLISATILALLANIVSGMPQGAQAANAGTAAQAAVGLKQPISRNHLLTSELPSNQGT